MGLAIARQKVHQLCLAILKRTKAQGLAAPSESIPAQIAQLPLFLVSIERAL